MKHTAAYRSTDSLNSVSSMEKNHAFIYISVNLSNSKYKIDNTVEVKLHHEHEPGLEHVSP